MTTTPPGIERVLFTEEQVSARIEEVAAEITAKFRGRDLKLMGVLKGSVFFLTALARALIYQVAGCRAYLQFDAADAARRPLNLRAEGWLAQCLPRRRRRQEAAVLEQDRPVGDFLPRGRHDRGISDQDGRVGVALIRGRILRPVDARALGRLNGR